MGRSENEILNRKIRKEKNLKKKKNDKKKEIRIEKN